MHHFWLKCSAGLSRSLYFFLVIWPPFHIFYALAMLSDQIQNLCTSWTWASLWFLPCPWNPERSKDASRQAPRLFPSAPVLWLCQHRRRISWPLKITERDDLNNRTWQEKLPLQRTLKDAVSLAAKKNSMGLPEVFALFAHSDTSSCDLPSVNTTLTRGMSCRAPSFAVKLNSNMWRRAEPVMEPRPMYCTCDTARWTSCAEAYWLRVNSARTLVEYCRRPTRVPVLEMSNESTMLLTNCLTSLKLAGPKLLEPSMTKTRSSAPLPHSDSVRRTEHRRCESLQVTDSTFYAYDVSRRWDSVHISTLTSFLIPLIRDLKLLRLHFNITGSHVREYCMVNNYNIPLIDGEGAQFSVFLAGAGINTDLETSPKFIQNYVTCK